MFTDASNFVNGVDTAFAVILGFSVFFLIAISAVMIYFVIRYNRKRNPKATNIEGNHKLEIIWTVIPTILVLVMFYYGWAGYQPMRDIPKDAIPIKATAQMWSWQFEYENGKTSDTLVVPKDKAVVLNLFSRDVLHSLYIPAFRIKEDVVPGRNNQMWFIGQKEGDYNIFCAEYCGDRHSQMLSKVWVLEEGDYNKWYNDTTASADPPGLQVMKKNACLSCHSLDGSRIVGPTFKGIWGKTETVVTNGEEREIVVDEAYIRSSIYDPNADVTKGYNQGLMLTTYKDIISEEEMGQIIDYLKTLK
ncbi:MAG: cytochrome c oxidase subunit II [Bacteroidales bacterium]|nr:cytochrome c oxidase subunit II [Bacteroidales bacterium]MCF8402430.1 cytochrome c oxidase subunit II [Bacteroidales bacterium]